MANDDAQPEGDAPDAPLHAQSDTTEDGEARTTPFSDDELEHFRELILQRRQEAKSEIGRASCRERV